MTNTSSKRTDRTATSNFHEYTPVVHCALPLTSSSKILLKCGICESLLRIDYQLRKRSDIVLFQTQLHLDNQHSQQQQGVKSIVYRKLRREWHLRPSKGKYCSSLYNSVIIGYTWSWCVTSNIMPFSLPSQSTTPAADEMVHLSLQSYPEISVGPFPCEINTSTNTFVGYKPMSGLSPPGSDTSYNVYWHQITPILELFHKCLFTNGHKNLIVAATSSWWIVWNFVTLMHRSLLLI